MAKILTGKEVAEALNVRKSADVEKLKLRGIIPTLCIFRVGNRADDISYEKGAMKRAEKIGVAVKQIILPEDVREDVFEAELKKANEDPLIHGILLFRPLPPQLALLSGTSSQIEELAVAGSLAGDKEMIYQAICYDPLTAAVLSLREIREMVDEMFRQNEPWLPQFKK